MLVDNLSFPLLTAIFLLLLKAQVILLLLLAVLLAHFRTDGSIDFPTLVKYKNEWANLGAAPAAATYPGYFFIVDGDDNPYVNINITAGGVGDTRATLLTEYSSIGLLSDVDVTTTAPTNNQVLKWNTSSSKWLPADDDAGIGSINLFATVAGDTGSTTANSQSDTLTIAGGTGIATTVVGDTLTIDFNATLTTTFADLTDTNTTNIAEGNSLFYNGTQVVPAASPVIWWNLGANGSASFTFDGPGFEDTIQSNKEDPDLYLYRGFTYVFDNTTNGGNHPSVSKTLKDYKAHHILMDSLEVAVAYYISLCLRCTINSLLSMHNSCIDEWRNKHRILINGKNYTWIWRSD